MIQISDTDRREQAFGGGKQCAHAVTFDRASFKNEVQAVDVLTSQSSGFYGLSGDQIVQLGGKFQSPAIEGKVEQGRVAGIYHGDSSVVACPCIVRFAFQKAYIVHVYGRGNLLLNLVGLRSHN